MSQPLSFFGIGSHMGTGWGPQAPLSATPASPPLLGGAAQDTAPNAPTYTPPGFSWAPSGWDKHAATAFGGPGQYYTSPGDSPGGTAGTAPAPTEGTLSGPGTAEQWFSEHGSEFTAPGPAQDFYAQHKDDFTQPTNAEQYFAGVAGSHAPHAENRSDQAYNQYQREMPGMTAAPDLGTYYDFAKTRGLGDLGKQQAARGVFGSSVASGQAGDFVANMEAQRANREADYNLARNADRRASLMGAGSLAHGADTVDLANGAADLGWMSTLGGLAQGADASGRAGLALGEGAAANASNERQGGLSSGMTAAGMAQGAEQGREQGALSNILGLYSLLSGMGLGAYGQELGVDSGLMDSGIAGGIAGATNANNIESGNTARIMGDAAGVGQIMTGLGALGWT